MVTIENISERKTILKERENLMDSLIEKGLSKERAFFESWGALAENAIKFLFKENDNQKR